jgi:phage terminase large subunit-like protein
VIDDLLLSDDEIAALTPAQLERYHELLEDEAADPTAWRLRARPEQRPPDEWQTIFYRGGRGGGKSWTAAHLLAELILTDPLREAEGPGQWAVVAPTYGDVRDVCVEAPESGLLAALGTSRAEVDAGRSERVELWNRSTGELRLRDNSVVFCDGADDGALRIQGKNLRGCWAEEIGLWRQWERAFDESIGFALRKGAARLVVTGTPKADMPARMLVRRLLDDPEVVNRRLRTMDNAAHLSAAFIESARLRAGTRLARQELEGELLEDIEGALVERAWLDEHRVERLPGDGRLARCVVGLDPAEGSEGGAEQAIAVVGLSAFDNQIYLLHSEGMRTSPLRWLKRAIRITRQYGGTITAEKTGALGLAELIEQAIRSAGTRVAYRLESPRESKLQRGQQLALLAETGRFHLVGRHDVLEEQLVTYVPGGTSPDLMDACVHAVNELAGYRGMTGEAAVAPWSEVKPVPGDAVVAWEEPADWSSPSVGGEALERWAHPGRLP